MGGFFKMFFASLLALIIFSVIGFFLFLVLIAGLAKSDAPLVEKNSVLVVNIGQFFQEQKMESPLAIFSSNDELSVPGVYDVVRLIQKAAKDHKIKGIYLQSGINPNGFASSEEIRNALIAFKQSGKFIIAYSEMMNQKSYHVANVADKVYVNPKGFFDWTGFSLSLIHI